MKWIKLESDSSYNEFFLQHNGTTVLNLRHNKETDTVRLKAGNEKRLMMIDTTQLVKNRISFLNEYGINIGSLSFTNSMGNSGVMEMNGYSYYYILSGKNPPGIDIYDSADHRLLAHGTLFPLQGINDLEINNMTCFAEDNFTPVVAGLLWYIDVKEMSAAETA